MDASRTQHSQAPAKLAHHFVVLHYRDGTWNVLRFSGPPVATKEMAAWVCRLCARQGLAATTYAGAEQAWPPIDMMDIAEDVAKDEAPL